MPAHPPTPLPTQNSCSKGGHGRLGWLYARELALWGTETSIIVPGALTKGTNHFAHAGVPADKDRLAQYEAGACKGYGKKIQEAFAAIVPEDAEVGAVAEAIVKVVDAPFGPPRTEPRYGSP